MKTSPESRKSAREIASAMADGSLSPSSRIAGGTILALLDDVDELLNANARLAPKAKAHDRLQSYIANGPSTVMEREELLRIAEAST